MKMESFTDVNIFFSGDDPDDRNFAETILNSAEPFCFPAMIDVDSLEQLDDSKIYREERFPGVPIFILSPGMLRRPEYRRKIVDGTPARNLPGHSVFYICRGITVDVVRDQYPELDQLFFDVMVGEEKDLPVMLEELQAYLIHAGQGIDQEKGVRAIFSFATHSVVFFLGFIGYGFYLAGFLCAAWLPYSIWLSASRSELGLLAACCALFSAGYGFNRLKPFDLWPWIGPAWRIGGRKMDSHPDSSFAVDRIPSSVRPWRQSAYLVRLQKILALCWLLIPGGIAAAESPKGWLGLAALLSGLLIPRFWPFGLKYVTQNFYRNAGLGDEEMSRTAKAFSPYGLATTLEPEYQSLVRWGGSMVLRPWLMNNPRVFISYAWRDKQGVAIAQYMEKMISQLGVNCFLDTRGIPGKFSSWRSRIAEEILKCTHFFVALGPNALEGGTIPREIRTALQRWHTGLEPAVICVIEPETASALEKEHLTEEVKFLLRDAPKLTFAEAANPDILLHMIRQRRRQGLVRDWLALLNLGGVERAFIDIETSQSAEISQ
jgi:hypothetical protein